MAPRTTAMIVCNVLTSAPGRIRTCGTRFRRPDTGAVSEVPGGTTRAFASLAVSRPDFRIQSFVPREVPRTGGDTGRGPGDAALRNRPATARYSLATFTVDHRSLTRSSDSCGGECPRTPVLTLSPIAPRRAQDAPDVGCTSATCRTVEPSWPAHRRCARSSRSRRAAVRRPPTTPGLVRPGSRTARCGRRG